MHRNVKRLGLILLCVSFVHAFGYSVLSHEEVIDLMWDSDIRPALLKRFPSATPAQLKRAHAYAYGGSVIQDLGYYPLGNRKFTDILHYVRSGDFVATLIRDSRNMNEFAFALGALSHYAADSWGHISINLSVPREYPKLHAKYGDWVTYENDHDAHLNTEFSFDVLERAKHRYNSHRYHHQIGFQVPEELLERAFADTYGISLDHLLHFDDLTIEIYKITVGTIIPEGVQIAIATHKQQIGKEKRDPARTEFLLHVSHADYKPEFGNRYRRPGPFATVFGFILKLIPFGPAKVLGYRTPTPTTEDLYFRSTNDVLRQYHRLVEQVDAGDLNFPNRNLDTGELTREGRYALADVTYAGLVHRLQRDQFRHIDAAMRANILEDFAHGEPENGSIKPKNWQKTAVALQQLKAAPNVPEPSIRATGLEENPR